MTHADHIRLAFPDRHFSIYGDQLVFDDGLPAPSEEDLAQSYGQAHSAWLVEQRVANAKTWPTKTEFWAEFDMEQKAAILSSSNVTVATLLDELRMWDYTIRADDPRIIAGMEALVSAGIISQVDFDRICGLH